MARQILTPICPLQVECVDHELSVQEQLVRTGEHGGHLVHVCLSRDTMDGKIQPGAVS